MGISQKDIKLLWGRSGNRCAFCKTELTQDKESVTASYTLGEQAHIVGEKETAARGVSLLDQKERDAYPNRILLCPTHHTEIDNNEEDWPIEKLHQEKSRHELWVTETLAEFSNIQLQADQAAVTSVVDSAVELCGLQNWRTWTTWTLSADPHWHADRPEDIFEFRRRVLTAIWPDDYDELRRATDTLAVLLSRAAKTFLEHSDLRSDNVLRPNKFYKSGGFNPNYDADIERYKEWVLRCHDLVREATKAANWFAEIVRRDVNPMFFVEKGRFMIEEGPLGDFDYTSSCPEFTQEEKDALPNSIVSS